MEFYLPSREVNCQVLGTYSFGANSISQNRQESEIQYNVSQTLARYEEIP